MVLISTHKHSEALRSTQKHSEALRSTRGHSGNLAKGLDVVVVRALVLSEPLLVESIVRDQVEGQLMAVAITQPWHEVIIVHDREHQRLEGVRQRLRNTGGSGEGNASDRGEVAHQERGQQRRDAGPEGMTYDRECVPKGRPGAVVSTCMRRGRDARSRVRTRRPAASSAPRGSHIRRGSHVPPAACPHARGR